MIISFFLFNIYVNENLKWNEHINYLYNVAQVSSYQISKSSKTNSATIMTNVFKIYFCPKIEYITQFWSPFKKNTLTKLSLCKKILPILYVVVIRYPIQHTMID